LQRIRPFHCPACALSLAQSCSQKAVPPPTHVMHNTTRDSRPCGSSPGKQSTVRLCGPVGWRQPESTPSYHTHASRLKYEQTQRLKNIHCRLCPSYAQKGGYKNHVSSKTAGRKQRLSYKQPQTRKMKYMQTDSPNTGLEKMNCFLAAGIPRACNSYPKLGAGNLCTHGNAAVGIYSSGHPLSSIGVDQVSFSTGTQGGSTKTSVRPNVPGIWKTLQLLSPPQVRAHELKPGTLPTHANTFAKVSTDGPM